MDALQTAEILLIAGTVIWTFLKLKDGSRFWRTKSVGREARSAP